MEFVETYKYLDWGRSVTMKMRVMLISLLALATMWMAGCGHYKCGATFGNSSCSAGGGGNTNGGQGGTYLYIADAGGIQGEVIDVTTKSLKVTPGFGTVSVPTNVPGNWMVTAQAKYMYTGYTSIGDIYGWALVGNGSITFVNSGQPFTATYLTGATSGGPQAMITNPAGTLLFATDPVGEQVHVYQIGSGGVLTEASTSPLTLPSGFEPYNLATDGLGKYLYVSNLVAGTTTSEVAIYTIASTGALTVVTGSPFASTLQQMQGESSGKYMIGITSNFLSADGNVYVATIDQSTGAFSGVTPFASGGFPNSLAVQPSSGGNLVYTFDGGVEGFQLNLSTGALTAISGSPFTSSGVNGQFDQNGKILFVVESTAPTTILDAYDLTSSTSATTPIASVGWTQGAWAAADVP